MRKMIVVAVREYQAAVRTKAFIITLIAMPILFGGSIAAHALLRGRVDTKDRTVAIVDNTGRLYDALARAADERNRTEVFEGEGTQRKKVRPSFVIQKAQVSGSDPEQMRFELSQRVRKGEIMSFVSIGRDVIEPVEGSAHNSIAYHSNAPTYDDLRRWLGQVLNDRIRELRLEAAALDPAVVRKATQYTPVANFGLVERDEAGRITEAEEANELANLLVPMMLMMLMFMAVMIGAQPLMQSVLEEKMQRIAEVLLGSIPPFQLMMGKLLGTVGMSLTLLAVYLVGGCVAIHRAGYGEFFPAHVIWWFVVFQTLAVLMYGSLYIAVGAAVSDLKEAQSVLMPVMIVVMLPLFVWMYVVEQPAATLSVAMSLFPPATPMLMVLRQAVPPGVPLWQPLLGIVLVLLTTVACVFAASRIFRVGILMQGKGARVGEMLHWVLRG